MNEPVSYMERGTCLNPKCKCHTTKKGRVLTPFPMDYGPCYCCSFCSSTRAGMVNRDGSIKKSFLAQQAVLLLLLAVCCAHAQGWYGTGLSALPQSSPKPSGWAAYATCINTKAQLYSISELDYTAVPQPHGPTILQSSIRTGFATPLRTFGPVTLYALADAGTATVGVGASGAYAGGGVLVIPLPHPRDFTILIGIRSLHTNMGGTQQFVEIGFGWGIRQQ